MSVQVGKFQREFKKDGTEFICRGLTVGEYIDLIEQKNSESITDGFYARVGISGLVGFDVIITEDGSKYRPEDIDYNWDYLDINTLAEIGRFVFHELTIVSDEDKERAKGFIHFLYWSSDDKNQKQVETFNCSKCLNSGRSLSRPCGKYSREKRESYVRDAREIVEKAAEQKDRIKKSLDKYSNKQIQSKRRAKALEDVSEDDVEEAREKLSNTGSSKNFMMLGDYKFPECPISWVDPWLKMLCEAVYYAEKSDRNFFSGGVADQPYKLWEISKVVKNTYNQIEKKEMEKRQNG